MGMTYAGAGVDISAGEEAVRRIHARVKGTFPFAPGKVLTDLGGFSGLLELPNGMVVGHATDGVGTKLKLAVLLNRHDTVGIDLVAMSVNDLIVAGVVPGTFLDYIAMAEQEVERTVDIVSGIVTGCEQAEVALVGGEMAELPALYVKGDYDLAGFATGYAASKDDLILGDTIAPDMHVYGLSSSGIHSNGFSLIWKVFGIDFNDPSSALAKLNEQHANFGDVTLGEVLLKPTVIYVRQVKQLLKNYNIIGMVHVTGGGLIENPPRVLPDGCAMELKWGSWEVPGIFHEIQQRGPVEEYEMKRTFNMGLGMLVVSPDDIPSLPKVGRIISGDRNVSFVKTSN